MKKYFYWFFAALIGIVACTSKPSYEVKLKLTGASGKAYLSQRQNGKMVKLDSTQLQNGEGVLKGSVEIPEVYYLEVSSVHDMFPLFVENSIITVEGIADSLQKAKVTGSKVHDEYNTFQAKLNVAEKAISTFFIDADKAKESGKQAKADSLRTLGQKAVDDFFDIQKSYVKANPSSFISPYVLAQFYHGMEAGEVEAYLNGFDKKLDSVQIVKSIKAQVAKLKLVAVGQVAPDFTMETVDGTSLKLSDVYSKNLLTLIDFWASWCGPCRGENPNVVAVYNEYNTKGLGILGVSLDAKKEDWQKAIADDQLTWLQVSDLKGWQNEAAVLYAVNSIPSNLLVDKTGKIVAKNLREEKLKETISGLLK
jgi:peroxiredoxin